MEPVLRANRQLIANVVDSNNRGFDWARRPTRVRRNAFAVLIVSLLACQAPADQTAEPIKVFTPLTHSSCNIVTAPIPPADGTYDSCAEVFDAGPENWDRLGRNECYRLQLNTKARCRYYRVLVIPTYQDVAELGDVFDLDVGSELDDLVDWFEVGSYGQLVLDYEVVGGLTNGRAAWIAADVRSYADVDLLATLVDNNSVDHSLDEYDSIIWLTTKEGRPATGSIDAEIPAASGGFHWRGPSIVIKDLDVSNSFRHITRHELGHALALHHSSGGSSLTGPDSSKYLDFASSFEGYYDAASPMGTNRGHYHAFEKERLGWLPSELIHQVAEGESETVIIGSLDAAIQKTKAVRIPAGDGAEYWLDAPRGGDMLHNLGEGVIVRFKGVVGGDPETGTWTLDATRETPNDRHVDGALMPGRTFRDDERGVYMTVTSATEQESVVEIHQSPDNPNEPEIHSIALTDCSVSPCTGTLSERADANGPTFMFVVDATDADGDDLSIFWRFDVEYGGLYKPGSFGAGTPVRHRFIDAMPRRVFVMVSDRRGGLASSYVDLPLYVAARPVIDEVTAIQVGESTFQFSADVSEQELITTRWTIEDTTSHWREPRHQFAVTPDCVDVELRVTDRVQYRTWNGCVALNHNPIASLEVTRAVSGLPPVGGAAYGEFLLLDAGGSTDTDGDSLSYSWSDSCGLLDGDEVLGAINVAFNSMVACTFTVSVSDGFWSTTSSAMVMPETTTADGGL